MSDHDRKTRRRIETLEKESRERDASLGKDLSEVRDSVSRTQNVVMENITAVKGLREDLDEVQSGLSAMMEDVAAGLRSLASSIQSLEARQKQASLDLVTGLEKTQETSRRGLQQVSTGIAIADSLKSAAEAEEIEVDMGQAVKDLEARQQATELALEEKRLAFDRAARNAFDQLQRDCEEAGAHVVELQGALEESLTATASPASSRADLGQTLAEARRAAARRRSDRVVEAVSSIDLEALGDLAEVRRAFDDFVARFATPHPAPEAGIDHPMGFPFVAVAAAESDYLGDQGSLAVYGPDAEVVDCASEPEAGTAPDSLRAKIARLSEPLTAAGENRSPIDEPFVDVLKAEIAVLERSGVLRRQDAAALVEHLDRHPLFWLDS